MKSGRQSTADRQHRLDGMSQMNRLSEGKAGREDKTKHK